jgi:hypothetical protein
MEVQISKYMLYFQKVFVARMPNQAFFISTSMLVPLPITD